MVFHPRIEPGSYVAELATPWGWSPADPVVSNLSWEDAEATSPISPWENQVPKRLKLLQELQLVVAGEMAFW